MQRIQCLDSTVRSEFGKCARCSWREGQHRNKIRLKKLLNLIGCSDIPCLQGADQYLAKDKRSATKDVAPLPHHRVDMLDAGAQHCMIFQPISEDHGVPEDSPHLS